MTPLKELAKVIRSKNAGPYELTFDVMFTEVAVYEKVRDSGVLNVAAMAELFQVDSADVRYCGFFEPALAFKLTLVRNGFQGSIGEHDTFGAQQHAPLMEVQVPL